MKGIWCKTGSILSDSEVLQVDHLKITVWQEKINGQLRFGYSYGFAPCGTDYETSMTLTLGTVSDSTIKSKDEAKQKAMDAARNRLAVISDLLIEAEILMMDKPSTIMDKLNETVS